MSIEEVLTVSGNDSCADCGNPGPRWVSCGPAVLVCDSCAEIHRKIRPPPNTDQFDDSSFGGASGCERPCRYCVVEVSSAALVENTHLLQLLVLGGNEQAKRRYEALTPISYRRPTANDPPVLREQWIRGKYERLEFIDDHTESDESTTDREQLPPFINGLSSAMLSVTLSGRSHSPLLHTTPSVASPRSNVLPAGLNRRQCDRYMSGHKNGFLWKQGREDRRFHRRWFVLDEDENTLRYYNQDNMNEPKGTYRIDDMNIVLIPDKLDHPNGMQITCEVSCGQTRNIFVYAGSGMELVEWYSCIRWVKFNRLLKANPSKGINELVALLTRDFTREGWLNKTGPKKTGSYRRRWMTLDGHRNKIRYFKDPLDAYPRGEITLGTVGQGFGVLPTVDRRPSNELLLVGGAGARGVISSTASSSSQLQSSAAFTLITPTRHYCFVANNADDKAVWVQSLMAVINSPII